MDTKYYCSKQVLVIVSVVVINTMTIDISEKVLIHLTTLRSYSISEGSQGRQLKTGADTENMEECYFCVPPRGLFHLFFTTSRGVATLAMKWIFSHQLSL